MEGNKKVGSSSSSSSSSSLASELFGSKDPPSSSTGIFGSIFAPPSKVLGRESLRHDLITKRYDSPKEPWNTTKPGPYGNSSKGHEGENQNMGNRNIYEEERVEPCHLSSSIYYGGQDVCFDPKSREDSELNSVFNKDLVEDDPGFASRGNWWQGSLYY
ncbi:hypothetical protein ES319_A11G359300v1 [Gossypium barbadense]|uniref:Uncharacterized protein n=1 Tax=Gossypium barbadense TaxID=3634 RepID=A0A5J5TXC1_GOSBA|nr:hypothetical protein ES319_A11G359300v1 [Gossypium barbadense]KAB2060162.1 hypothetical protein ES319_A11G359300v1 [Gossypium barbadense]